MKKNTVLIIGSGGREHALGWKLKLSEKVEKIYFAPGNAGTAQIGENVAIGAGEIEKLVAFAQDHNIDLTVVGPDDSLAAGLVDAFQKENLNVFGPTKAAAQVESSKAFAKEIMTSENIPTATFQKFTDVKAAKAYASKQALPVVVKASGLALGKGVIVAQTHEEAEQALDDMMVKKVFGAAGEEVVIEEFLEGQEVSIHAFCDGKTVAMFPIAKDHKTIYDNNQGPNTGGMGTIAPVPNLPENLIDEIKQTIVLPLLNGLEKRGIKFSGLLFPGLMLTKNGPKVLEFNARFGDPETQSYMRLLDTDLFDILNACAEGTLEKLSIKWSEQSACCIILASEGYPGSYEKGVVIHGLEKISGGLVVFHAGTKQEGDNLVTSGGRVLGITADGEDLKDALSKAYAIIGDNNVSFDGMQYRKDIGKQALLKKK